jgi:endonuclease/exonuclease/phosphatase family metal-dependent hydrolase
MPDAPDLRVPWVIRPARALDVVPATRLEGVASLLDVMPTLLELAGIPVRSDLHGFSRAAELRGESRTRPRRLHFARTLVVAGASIVTDDEHWSVFAPALEADGFAESWTGLRVSDESLRVRALRARTGQGSASLRLTHATVTDDARWRSYAELWERWNAATTEVRDALHFEAGRDTAELAARVRALQTAAPEVELRIVSYNIRHGVGLDGALDLERTAAVLAAQAPDVVLLQEVDERCERSGSVDQAAWLGERLGMQHRFAAFMDHDGGRYGLATLSRAPIVASRAIPLPPGRQEPRTALEVTLSVAGREVRVANAHLDWLDESPERLAQAEALCDALAPLRAGPLVVGGDLNDAPTSAALAALLTAEDGALTRALSAGDGATFPADEPRVTIDHLLYGPSGAWRASGLSIVEERVASDHRPIALVMTLVGSQRGH